MKLVRVDVEHFACIRKAAVELGPGLNVLFGPNDLGKSTLAQAIRAALLLPCSSSAADSFIEWETDEQPFVRVTFEIGRRFWQVEKRFGTPGSSLLRESNDGSAFSVVKKAREVDEELRTLLCWGIARPGGARGPRGLPPSFLSTVLLGEQANVAGVLQATLEADSDESGRARLTAALQAFAQDPLFKAVLDEAQGWVDAGFTSKGRRRADRTSPFRQVTEDVKRVKELYDQVARRVSESETAAQELERCQARLVESFDRVDRASTELATLRGLRNQGSASEAAARQLAVAKNHLDNLQGDVATLATREAELRDAQIGLEQTRAERSARAAERDVATGGLQSAEDGLRRATSDDAEQQRRIRLGELQTERLELEAKAAEVSRERGANEKARAAEARLAQTERDRIETSDARARLQTARTAARGRLELIDRQLELLQVAASVLELRQTQREIDGLHQIQVEIAAERAGARAKRDEADAAFAQLPQGLPTTDAYEALRSLRHQLDVAEARLGGGIAVAIERLQEKLAIEVGIDGSDWSPPSGASFTVEGSRTVRLGIADVARLTITAGEKDARALAAALTESWMKQSSAILERAGAADLDALGDRIRAATKERQRIDDLRNAASGVERQAAARETQLGRLPDLERAAAAVTAELIGKPVADAEKLLDDPGAQSVDDRRTELVQERAGIESEINSRDESIRDCDKKQSALDERRDSAAQAVAEIGLARPDPGWEAVIARLDGELLVIAERTGRLTAAIESLAAERDAQVERAEAAVATAKADLQAATDALAAATARAESVQDQASRLGGEVETRRAQVAQLDIDGARRLVQVASDAFDALPTPARHVDDVELAVAEQQLDSARREHETAKDDARKAEGALQTVGGQVVREEEEVTKEAVRLAEQKERDVELEYDAWRLLVEKLREAETTEGLHLGEALAVPVSKRFAALTGGRYGKLEVSPVLQTNSVRTAGATREVASLSVGTQEQLATLLRLTIAEHLGSMLVLDDHLTQADPARGATFVDVLREHGDKAQVIILTCRPLDYVREADLPGDEVSVTRAGGLVRVTDLSRVILRA